MVTSTASQDLSTLESRVLYVKARGASFVGTRETLAAEPCADHAWQGEAMNGCRVCQALSAHRQAAREVAWRRPGGPARRVPGHYHTAHARSSGPTVQLARRADGVSRPPREP